MRGKLFEDLVVSARGGRPATRTLALPASAGLHVVVAVGAALVTLGPPQPLSAPKPPSPLPVYVPPEVRVTLPPAGGRPPAARPPQTSPRAAASPVPPPLNLPSAELDSLPIEAFDPAAPSLVPGLGPAGTQPGGDPNATGSSPGPAGIGGPRRGDPPLVPGGLVDPPRLLRSVKPVYPEMARLVRLQGDVELQCIIETDGRVIDVKVLRGQPILSGAAALAVEQWLYAPTRLNGIPVRVILTVKVKFTLQ